MSTINSVYNELRLEKQFCDAVIRVGNAEFHVHKVIMINCSPYFRCFFPQWSSPDSQLLEVHDVSPEMMQLIVEFAYTGFVPVTLENVQELFVTADRFNIMAIIEACCDVLEEQLASHNCIGIWRFTNHYWHPAINNKAFVFLLNHFEVVAATSEEFLLLSLEELAKIIENDKLIVKKEKTVFEAVIRWITYSTEERREYISLLLSKVRLFLVSPEYILECVNNVEVVKSSEECHRLLLRVMEMMIDIRTNSLSSSFFGHPLNRRRLPAAILLACGGWSGSGPTNAIEAYDVGTDCWVNITHTNVLPQAHHGTAFFNGSLYCIGGFDGVQYFSTMYRYNLGVYTWEEVAPMHSRRGYATVTVLDGYIYVMGGFDGHNRLHTAERYEPTTNRWTSIASMNTRRSDAYCATLSGKIYICGGFNGNRCLSTAEFYTPGTNQWTVIAPMSISRRGVGVITYAGCVFAIGGFNGTTRLQTAEAYDPETNTWSDMPSMRNRRSDFGIGVINDCLFVVGGFDGFRTIPDVECYDTKTGQWSDVSCMEITRSALSCCTVYGLSNIAEYMAPYGKESSYDRIEGEAAGVWGAPRLPW